MTDRAAFLQAIIAAPADNLPAQSRIDHLTTALGR
jgi:hypothetical protein